MVLKCLLLIFLITKTMQDVHQFGYIKQDNKETLEKRNFSRETDLSPSKNVTESVTNILSVGDGHETPLIKIEYIKEEFIEVNTLFKLQNSKTNLAEGSLTNTDTPKTTNLFYCYDCGYSTSDKKQLIKHVQIDMGNTDLVMPVGKKLLKCAKDTQSQEKPYKCGLCDYQARYLSKLKVHLQTHTDDKPFKCKQCNFCTHYQANLTKHLIVHASNK